MRDDNGGPPKVNCSMKVVSQEDGSDLDPNSTAVSRGGGGRGRGGGDMGFRGPQRDAPPEVLCTLHCLQTLWRPAWHVPAFQLFHPTHTQVLDMPIHSCRRRQPSRIQADVAGWEHHASQCCICEALWDICALEGLPCQWPCASLAGKPLTVLLCGHGNMRLSQLLLQIRSTVGSLNL